MGKITISAEDARIKTDEAIKIQKEKEFELISAFITKMASEGKYGIKVGSLYKETKEALEEAGFKVIRSKDYENFYWYISWAEEKKEEEKKKGCSLIQFPINRFK